MPNRLTCTDKWKKQWFRKLSPKYKCFWIYLLDNCDHAGIWNTDIELAEIFIGEPLNINEIKIIFKDKYIEIDKGDKWVIIDFIEFQYKCSIDKLNPANKVHLSAIKILNKYKLLKNIKGLSSPLVSPMQGIKDKDKDKDKKKDKDKDKDKKKDKDKDKEIKFEEILKKYPNRDGQKMALKHFKASVNTKEDWQNINIAIENYLNSDRVKNGYIKNASTWFNNWRDFIDYKEVNKKQTYTKHQGHKGFIDKDYDIEKAEAKAKADGYNVI